MQQSKSIKVLIVEDNEGDARLIMETLKDDKNVSYDCSHMKTLRTGLEWCKEHDPDIVLLDFHLPDSLGIKTFDVFREHVTKIPVVVMTGLNDEKLAVEVVRKGAQDYLVKGIFDEFMLSRIIRYAIERHSIELDLKESEERYKIAVKGSNSGLWDWNLQTNEVYFSPSWKTIIGYEDGEIKHHADEWLRRIHPDDQPQFNQNLANHLNGRTQYFCCEYRILHKDKSLRWVLTHGICVRDKNEKPVRMAGSQTDITAKKKAEKQLVYNAFHDDLTGLPSRNLFSTQLQRAFLHQERHEDDLFAVIYLDLDRFKLVNDSMGHIIGDQLLISVARRLETCIRKVDLVSRIGGDEFAILFDPAINRAQTEDIAHRINKTLEEPFELDGQQIFISASIGIAMSNSGFKNSTEMIRDADTAMYCAKESGGKGVRFFSKEMHQQAVVRLRSENELQNAVNKRQFVLYYQPIIELSTGKIVGLESLIRWKHPSQGVIFPLDFIPLAEETGLILSIGEWVVRKACEQMNQIHNAFREHSDLFVSVNISFKQLLQPDFVGILGNILTETKINPARLGLEVTENGLMKNPEYFIKLISKIRKLGVELHVDDFGTGYSSLSYLHRFSFDKLKIDRDFLLDHGNGDRNIKILKSIIQLSHELGIETISEGVEDKKTLEFLRNLKCEYAQGFYFSKPILFDEIVALLKTNPQW